METDNRWKQLAHMIAVFILQEMREQMKNGVSGKIEPKALTIEQASVLTGRSVTALYRLVARREIPVVRHGRSLRFLVSDLMRWLEADKV